MDVFIVPMILRHVMLIYPTSAVNSEGCYYG